MQRKKQPNKGAFSYQQTESKMSSVLTTDSCLWQCFLSQRIYQWNSQVKFIFSFNKVWFELHYLLSKADHQIYKERHQVLTGSWTCFSSSSSAFFSSTFSIWGRSPSRFNSKPSLVEDLITNFCTKGPRKQRPPPIWSLYHSSCLQADLS